MRADRLLALLSLLQTHGRLSARDLAARLEVSERTVYRDIDALSSAGVPVYTERGRNGGCALVPGYRTDVSGLTAGEARALFTFTGRGLGLDADLRAALRKLLASLPQVQQPDAVRAQESVVVDPRGWRRDAEDAPHLATVQDAVWQGKRLRMAYRGSGRDAATDREVDPYGLVAKAGVWYLVAASDGEPRLFRAARITAAEVLVDPADRPPGLDLEALWERLRRRVEDRGGGTPVAFRVRAEVADRVLRVCAAQVTGPVTAPEPVDGWISVELPFVAGAAAAGVLAGFGADVEVLSPGPVRARLAEIGAALVARYG